MTSLSLTRLTITRRIKQGFGALGIGIFCLGFLAGCGERISEHGHVINQAEMDINQNWPNQPRRYRRHAWPTKF